MTSTGSGVGGNIGGPSQPMQRELETTAATEVVKQMWAIVKDTLEIPFTQLGGNAWKYQASANRPHLPPFDSQRVLTQFESPPDTSWKKISDDLTRNLPDDLRGRYQAQMQLPFEDRDLNFVVLDNVLSATAKAVAWLKGAGQPEPPGGPEEANAMVNQALPYLALTNTVNQGQFFIEEAKNFLNFAGANYVQYDNLHNYAETVGDAMDNLQSIQTTVRDGQTKPTPEEMGQTTKEIDDLKSKYSQYEFGNDLKILDSTLDSMKLVASTLPFLGTGDASLLLGLHLALTGSTDTKDTTLGFIGTGIATSSESLTKGLIQGYAPDAHPGAQELLQLYTTTALVGAYCLGTHLADHSFGVFPHRDEADITAAKGLQYDLLLHMISSTGVLKETFLGAIAATGVDEKKAQEMAQILESAALMMMILAGNGDPEKLMESLKDPLSTGLNTANSAVSEKLLQGDLEGKQTADLGVNLQQAHIGFNKEDYQGVLQALMSTMESSGASNETFLKNLEDLDAFTKNITQALNMAFNDETAAFTGIVQAA